MIRPLILLTLLSACAASFAHERHTARDPGGSVALRVMEIGVLEASGTPKRVSGECLSACTLYLGLSTACFEEDAVLGFHGPRFAGGLPMSDRQFEGITQSMAAFYPDRLARWFLAEARHSEEMVRIPARDLIARGEARACDR